MSGEGRWGNKVEGEERRWAVWGQDGNEDEWHAEVRLGMEGKSGERKTRQRHLSVGPREASRP